MEGFGVLIIRHHGCQIGAATEPRLAGGDERKADVFAHLLAANHVLISDGEIIEAEASKLAALIVELDEGEPSDEEACLSHLLGYLVTVDFGYKRTIGEWLIYIHDENRSGPAVDDVCAELERHGVKVDGYNIKVANATPGIKSVYAKSRWKSSAHWRVLRRLTGAYTGGNAWFAGDQSKCTVIPQKALSTDD